MHKFNRDLWLARGGGFRPQKFLIFILFASLLGLHSNPVGTPDQPSLRQQLVPANDVIGAVGPLPGEDDNHTLLDVCQSELNITDNYLYRPDRQRSHHDDNNEAAMLDIFVNDACSSSQGDDQHRMDTSDTDAFNIGSTAQDVNGTHMDVATDRTHGDGSNYSNGGPSGGERHPYNREDAEVNNNVEDAIENEETVGDVDQSLFIEDAGAQRMLDVFMNILNNDGELISFENLIGAVNVQNVDDYLSSWQRQHGDRDREEIFQQRNQIRGDGRDMEAARQVAGEETLEERRYDDHVPLWHIIQNSSNDDQINEERISERMNEEQLFARIPEANENREAQLHRNLDSNDNNLLVVYQNNIQPINNISDHHDNAVYDVSDDADGRVVVLNDMDNSDVIHDEENDLFDPNGNGAEFDLREFLNQEAAVVVPRLALGGDMDLAFDAGKYKQVIRTCSGVFRSWPEKSYCICGGPYVYVGAPYETCSI